MFAVLNSIIINAFNRCKFELEKEFNQDSPITKKDCNHRLLQRFPKGLYCCINCRRTFSIRLKMDEVKLNKYQFAELLALMPDRFEGSKNG